MIDYKIVKVKEIFSTNEALKNDAKEKKVSPGFVLIAEKQSKGHGQYGRSFESPPGGLYMSVFLQKNITEDVSGLSMAVGNAVKEAVFECCRVAPDIKPPNDLLYEDKKICGILIESFTFSGLLNIIVGIGLNLNTDVNDFSKELQNTADSVLHITGRRQNESDLVHSILEKLEKL